MLKINNEEYKVLSSEVRWVDATYNKRKGYSILVDIKLNHNGINGYINFYVDFFDNRDDNYIINKKYVELPSELNSKIDFQNQDIIKIFNNFNNVIENRERLNGAIKKVGNYSSMSHTNIEALSNIINTHKMKSSITFAPIIALLKSSKIR